MGKQFKLQTLLEIAIFAALAMLLDLIPSIKPHPSISISFAMIPIFIIAFRWGVRAAFISGFIWGILQIALGDAWILTPLQAFIEYFIAFAFIGFAGLFSTHIKRLYERITKKQPHFILLLLLLLVQPHAIFGTLSQGLFSLVNMLLKPAKAQLFFL